MINDSASPSHLSKLAREILYFEFADIQFAKEKYFTKIIPGFYSEIVRRLKLMYKFAREALLL